MPPPLKKYGKPSVAVRAVIDTNVWVSSILNPTGRPAMLRKAFEEGAFHVIISEPLLEEITDVLSRPKIKSRHELAHDEIEELLTLLDEHTEYALLSGDVDICSDKDDDFVIETAIKGKAEYLVTGDGDIKLDNDVVAFLSKYGVTVISIANFLNLIEKA